MTISVLLFDHTGGFMSNAPKSHQYTDESFRDLILLRDLSLDGILRQLGLFNEERELERLALFYQFQKSCADIERPHFKSKDIISYFSVDVICCIQYCSQ